MKITPISAAAIAIPIFFLITNVYSICNVYTGPENDLDCRSFSWIGTASGSQWARCLSRDRLRNITNGSLTCIFSYCNYLCMQEFYDLKAGEIYSDCQCTSEQLQNVDKMRPNIDDTCYKPNASDCSWYDRCFSKRYSNCTEPSNGQITSLLPVEFSKKFCGLIEPTPSYVSDYGRQWINMTHKCLMEKMSPLIRPWQNEACDKLDSDLMNFISPCFVKPNLSSSSTSICQLDCKTWWLVFRDIKNFFSMGNYKWGRILKQYFKYGVKGCDDDGFFSRCWSNSPTVNDFKKYFLFYRFKLVSRVNKPDPDMLAYQAIKKLLTDLRIDASVFDWHTSIDESSPDQFLLYIMNGHGLERLDSSTTSSSLNQRVQMELLRTVWISMKGMETRLPYDVTSQTSISSIETCADPMCVNVTASWSYRNNPAAAAKSAETKSLGSRLLVDVFASLSTTSLAVASYMFFNKFWIFSS